MSKYPPQNRYTCEYLERIGIDPRDFLVDGANEAGYYAIIRDERGHLGWDPLLDRPYVKLREWPNGPTDYIGFVRARNRDWRETHRGEARP